jgi:hypothetical protein
LKTHLRVTHLAVELGAWHERRDRVDDDDVDRAASDEHFGDLERLLTAIGLRDEELVRIDAERFRIDRVERMLGIHEGSHATCFLRFGNDVKRERGLA